MRQSPPNLLASRNAIQDRSQNGSSLPKVLFARFSYWFWYTIIQICLIDETGGGNHAIVIPETIALKIILGPYSLKSRSDLITCNATVFFTRQNEENPRPASVPRIIDIPSAIVTSGLIGSVIVDDEHDPVREQTW